MLDSPPATAVRLPRRLQARAAAKSRKWTRQLTFGWLGGGVRQDFFCGRPPPHPRAFFAKIGDFFKDTTDANTSISQIHKEITDRAVKHAPKTPETPTRVEVLYSRRFMTAGLIRSACRFTSTRQLPKRGSAGALQH
jgi:hypothetical protein